MGSAWHGFSAACSRQAATVQYGRRLRAAAPLCWLSFAASARIHTLTQADAGTPIYTNTRILSNTLTLSQTHTLKRLQFIDTCLLTLKIHRHTLTHTVNKQIAYMIWAQMQA